MSTAEIRLGPGLNDGAVILDGHDVSKAVMEFTLSGGPRQVPVLNLDLRVFDVTVMADDTVRIEVPEATADLLQRAGWIPPGHVCEGGARNEASLA